MPYATTAANTTIRIDPIRRRPRRRERRGGGGIISGSRLEGGRRLIPAKGSSAGRGCDLSAVCCGNLRLAAGGSFGKREVVGPARLERTGLIVFSRFCGC